MAQREHVGAGVVQRVVERATHMAAGQAFAQQGAQRGQGQARFAPGGQHQLGVETQRGHQAGVVDQFRR
ncbi:MAG: hypothetical protein DI603_07070 [Roseateles depolymerans]|uniref:Uncharacterized protein n=1 Tax=Roseateles depolymerans TaxID=76731 RepID=A0A2W5FS58_9BURK|nr:MAG: hypothetical protein DI603_07070 [Roseateles depolymerans]